MSGSNVYFSKAGFNSQTFTANGTFTVPEGVNNVLAYVVGGGGGGGGGQSGNGNGGGGGAGGEITFASLEVVPGASVAIAMGAGGAGGINGVAGSDGTRSRVLYNNKQVYAYGGLAGDSSNSGDAAGGPRQDLAIYQAPGGKGGNISTNPLDGSFNQIGYFEGGQAGGGAFSTGGGGGGSAHGQGGEGGTAGGNSDGFNAAVNSGGGGGGGCAQGGNSDGGNGGSGIVIIYWKKD